MLPLRRQALPGSPSWPLWCHRGHSLIHAGRSSGCSKTDMENTLYRQRIRCVPACIQSLHSERENGSELHLVFIRVIFAKAAFDLLPGEAAGSKELCGIRNPPRSFCQGKAQHGARAWQWGRLCVPTGSSMGNWLCLTYP